MDKNTAKHTKNLPGVPILPGRNTPLIQTGPPKNVAQPETPNAKSGTAAAPTPKPETK